MSNSTVHQAPMALRIGELAKLTGVTTRTLRYWEECGLMKPSAHRGSGERLYLPADMARVTRIKDLRELLGFTLAEVRVVLETEDTDALDRIRAEYLWSETSPARLRELISDAIEANESLLERLDDTLTRIGAFRDDRRVTLVQLREKLRQLDE